MTVKVKPGIAVLGTGWLGLPLAIDLADRFRVAGSYRRAETRDELSDGGVTPYFLDLPSVADALPDFLEGATVLVVTLPPGGRQHGVATAEKYLEALSPLQDYLPTLHVVYTSSTGVYGKHRTGVVTEDSPVCPDTYSSEAVVKAEEFFLRHADRCTLLRLGGLYGPGRDPVRFFRRVENIPDGDAPVNMVHRDEVLRAVNLILATGETGIFNVCAGRHPTKRQFYGNLYAAAGLPAKNFLPGGADGKRVNSAKLSQLGWYCP